MVVRTSGHQHLLSAPPTQVGDFLLPPQPTAMWTLPILISLLQVGCKCSRIQVGFEGTGVVLGKDKERGKRWDGPWPLFHLWICHAPLPAGPCNLCHWGLMFPTWSLTVRHWRESFPSALGPIQGLCLPWELLRGEKVLRIHPISSREKRNSGAMQQIRQWRGREMARVSLSLFLRAVALEFDLMPATHLSLALPLAVHSLWGHQLRVFHPTGSFSALLCRTSQTQNYPSQAPSVLDLLQKLSSGKRLQLLFYSFCFSPWALYYFGSALPKLTS